MNLDKMGYENPRKILRADQRGYRAYTTNSFLTRLSRKIPKMCRAARYSEKIPLAWSRPRKQRSIKGLCQKPEIDITNKALALLSKESILPLARISTFHFLFGYAHPFYNIEELARLYG